MLHQSFAGGGTRDVAIQIAGAVTFIDERRSNNACVTTSAAMPPLSSPFLHCRGDVQVIRTGFAQSPDLSHTLAHPLLGALASTLAIMKHMSRGFFGVNYRGFILREHRHHTGGQRRGEVRKLLFSPYAHTPP